MVNAQCMSAVITIMTLVIFKVRVITTVLQMGKLRLGKVVRMPTSHCEEEIRAELPFRIWL